jgi:hypothetical protein
MEELCASPWYPRFSPWMEIGFDAFSYYKEPNYDGTHRDKDGNFDGEKHKEIVTYSKSYDMNSIMQYDSDASRRTDLPFTVHFVPLCMWKKRGPDYEPPELPTEELAELIPRPDFSGGPSDGDAWGVRTLYPWGG